ncbi:GntR family transcriptional regulator [Mycoplasma sp. P36-A1]|uniref:GntR family transcriptional regulator n=1 Tax=Mycoplasma sp. P36-A1 TaxID=3252900 RepID=UPI003C30B4A0
MEFNFDNSSPLYKQLVNQLMIKIAIKDYPAGSKLPSVRELATIATINPNTVSKAFTELETLDLITTERTNGKFVTEDEHTIMELRNHLAKEYVLEFLKKMQNLGYDQNDILNIIEEELKEA